MEDPKVETPEEVTTEQPTADPVVTPEDSEESAEETEPSSTSPGIPTEAEFLKAFDALCDTFGYQLVIQPVWRKSLDTGTYTLDFSTSVVKK